MPLSADSPALYEAPFRADELETWELAKLLLFVGSCAGIAGGLVSAGLPLIIPQAFTQDVALHPIMRSVLPQVSVGSDLYGCHQGQACCSSQVHPALIKFWVLHTEIVLAAPLAGVPCNAAVRLGSQVWMLWWVSLIVNTALYAVRRHHSMRMQ
jgi:hypothetical protein